MEKLTYLIWSKPTGDRNQLQRQLLGEVGPALLEHGAGRLTIDVDDADSDVPLPMPWPEGETPLAAVVSFWLQCHDFRGPCEELLAGVGERQAGYLVTESIYREYGDNRWGRPRDWPDGQRSPGLVMVTLLEQPARLTYEQWIEHWYGTQSPLSEAMQPRMRYVRNAVARPLTVDAPPYKGIVEECWPSPAHLTDPMTFYGASSKQELQANMLRMIESVQGFLDFDRIRSMTMSEYLVSS